MIGKITRLATLRKIVATQRTDSQEKLIKSLKTEGFSVTQATLSRDLKLINVGKVPNGKGGYLYTFVNSNTKAGSDANLVDDFMKGFLFIEFSGYLGLIKTIPGHASSVAFALDNLDIPEILGTVAGDDTILIVPRDGMARHEIVAGLKNKIPGFKEKMQ